MKRTVPRILALIITLAMLIVSIPMALTASAEPITTANPTAIYSYTDDTKTAVTDGTAEYPVSTDANFLNAPYIVIGGANYYLIDAEGGDKGAAPFGIRSIYSKLDGKFILMSDITVSGEGNPIATTSNFTGLFEGNGKTITHNMTLNGTSQTQSLFVNLGTDAAIQNLNLNTTVDASAGVALAHNSAGVVVSALVGKVNAATTNVSLSNINVTANIDIKNTKTNDTVVAVCGLVGFVQGELAVADCTVNGSINYSKTGTNSYGYACGLIYQVANDNAALTVENCTNNANLTTTGSSGCAAGILGCYQDKGKSVILQNCTNTGTLTSSFRECGIVGFARKNQVSLCNLFSMIDCVNTGILSDSGKIVENLADYSLSDYRVGVEAVGNIDAYQKKTGLQVHNNALATAATSRTAADLVTMLKDTENPVYIVLISDLDMSGVADADIGALLSAYTGVVDFAGHRIINSIDSYNGTDTNILLSDVVSANIIDAAGIQTTTPADDGNGTMLYDLRAVCVVDDYTKYDAIEMEVILDNGVSKMTTERQNIDTVYTSLLEKKDDQVGTILPESINVGASYITALEIEGIDASVWAEENIDVTIKIYFKLKGAADFSEGLFGTVQKKTA